MPTRTTAHRLRRSSPTVAIVGATGAVGTEFLNILAEREFPIGELRLFASPRSAGKTLTFASHDIGVEAPSENGFSGVDLALFSAGSGTAREWTPVAVCLGAIVVDNSSAFRMNPAVPLVVPEINAAEIIRHDGIISVPNCAAIIAITPLWPIHRRNRIRRMIVATYQAASGGGAAMLAELVAATRAHLAGDSYAPRVLPHPYAFNLFSHDTPIDPATGYNEEEIKVIAETRKIFADPDIRVGVTCIRVPVLRAHSAAITIECEHPIDPDEARALIAAAPGCRIVDDPAANHFPMPNEATGIDDILVGRIRRDLSDPSGHSLSLFVSGDQLRKGAALNAIQIAEHLLPERSPLP
jgi:aspartate-semialdehyde dehydrogenase